ncbi:DUF3298 and DUF4163 domain-containing protein [Bacillus sp. 03113]|uniref:DUF3298 and DUF4163 domain-containing protein n=1 Tax=Bacillus sp. 03113 TaxID=2578211 RepID=UPI0011432AA5|nr:DUF3298 and DUF4163 domain-containing protein [Bacillus sp. 03113]
MQLPTQIAVQRIKQPRLDVYVPVVYGLANQSAQTKINQQIMKTVRELIQKQGYYENPQTEITGFFELKTNERGVLSLTIEHYSFSGGAHGMTYIIGLTFNVESGDKYKLADLFKPDSHYVEVLSKIVGQQIKERDIFIFEPFKSIHPNQDYYIADKSLVLYYQLYELTAYAYGFPYFPISIYDIQDIIKEGSPLQKMFG